MRETRGTGEGVDPIEHYLKVVYEKTACLIASAGRFGGMFSGADDEQVERLSRLGGIVGTAFQISTTSSTLTATPTSRQATWHRSAGGRAYPPMLYALREPEPEARGYANCWPGPSRTTRR